MDGSGTQYTREQFLRITVMKILILYVLVPVTLLILLATPVSEAVRRSDGNAFLIILAAAGVVGMNWLVYSLLHRKHPPVPVFAHGILCLIVIVFIEHFALPGYHALAPVLAYIGGFLALMDMLTDRRAHPKEGSYTTYLFEKGTDKILKKVGEESTEVIISAKDRDRANTIYEIGDLMYHVMVLMIDQGISLEDLKAEMASRHVIDKKVKQEKMK